MSSQRPCERFQGALRARAEGERHGPEQAALEAHLASCEACRQEAVESDELLGLLRLPEQGPRDRAMLATLAERTHAAFQLEQQRRLRGRRLVAGLCVAAGLALALVTPLQGLLKHPAPSAGGAVAAAPGSASEDDGPLIGDGSVEQGVPAQEDAAQGAATVDDAAAEDALAFEDVDAGLALALAQDEGSHEP